MEQLHLLSIRKQNCTISYDYSVSPGLSEYFSETPFFIEYPLDISSVPDSIAAIPFVCCVLPIVWLTNSALIVPVLDEDFYNCIPNVKKGYEEMYPESHFLGNIQVGSLVKNIPATSGNCAALFSGGLDATQTMVSHLKESPHLISIWGSDIRCDNKKGWDAVYSHIADTAQRYCLPSVVIRSSFRAFDREGLLDRDFSSQLRDSWWHGVKHGIALLGHTAPYSYLAGLSTVYIASSNCPADGEIRCASHPSIDNCVRFCGCKIVHDGFELSRPDKTHNIVKYCKSTGNSVFLHVCWESQSGKNCCRCEKCYRTMVSLIAEGADPYDYGFSDTAEALKNMQAHLLYYSPLQDHVAKYYWVHIQNCIKHNLLLLKKSPYWADIKWLLSVNFHDIRHAKLPLSLYLQNNGYLLREKLAQYKFYQALHRLKEKL